MLRLGRVWKPPEIGVNGHVHCHHLRLVPDLTAERAEPLREAGVLREHDGTEDFHAVLPREPIQQAEQERTEPLPLIVVDYRHGDLGDVRRGGQPREPAHADTERLVRGGVKRTPRDVVVLIHVREVGELLRAELRDRSEEARDPRRRREAGEAFLKEVRVLGPEPPEQHRRAVVEAEPEREVGGHGKARRENA